jgi:hypothetical protein
VPIYLPVFCLPILFFYPTSLIKAPLTTLKRLLLGVARSSSFLSLFVTMGMTSIGPLRAFGLRHSIVGNYAHMLFAIAGGWAGLATLVEKKGRRVELGLFVFSKGKLSALS